ncbi:MULTISPECIES: tripartite tricarboxylate transporter substrate binding protein [Rhodomicrobium]|uniref:Bug family tripartite tricarboxylate transporter substrate binding protein n=1 Tax=Rhodomicrobium TaxID=1068 RepID=UPI000B4B0F97|nr:MULTISPECIES: tripartite tricarboxylate transporter substrate binding protein [Rhodomicrobium]
MQRRDFLFAAASLGAGSMIPGIFGRAAAQDYPTQPVTIYVPFAAGGASDILTRLVSDYARTKRNIAVGVEFRPGAGGTIAPSQVARAVPDGASLGFYSVSPFLTVPHLQSLPYQTLADFTFISIYAYIPIAFYVAAESPITDWAGLIKFAKDNPGKLRWGTAGVRGIAHLAVEAAFRTEGIKATFVPFAGGSEAITALLGNHIEAVVSADYGPQVAAKRVRLLAFTGTEKLAGYESLPTFRELKYPLATEALYGLFGPAKLPKNVVAYWEGLIKEMTGSEAYKTALATANASPIYLSSAEFRANVEENYKKLGEQIDELGLKTKGSP